MSSYFRPLVRFDAPRPAHALTLAGGWCWFDQVEVLWRDGAPEVIAATELPPEVRDRLTAPREPMAGVEMDEPSVMGILNVTPDSFSDGGQHFGREAALAHGRIIAAAGAHVLDIGGESTRPGAEDVSDEEEIARTVPVIRALREEGLALPISIDTRKAPVARAAFEAGADILNDVAALTYDDALGPLAAERKVPVCLMHAQGSPATMQDNPSYDDVLMDVYDWLAERVAAAEAAGIDRARIMVDPGIGFGKTVAHNLALIRGISLFHGLGCPLLLGASRKRFIGALSGAGEGYARMPGSLAVALAGIAQGVQLVRVHDVAETVQAVRLWQAVTSPEGAEE